MSLAYRERWRLRNVDRALRRSDPGLAAMLSMFARLSEPDKPSRPELLRVSWSWAWRLVLGLVAGAAFAMVCVAGGGFGASRRAATAVGGMARHPPGSTLPG
jgi:hypothetical protein